MASPAQKYRFSGVSAFNAENIEQLDEMLEDLYTYLSQSPLGATDEDFDLASLSRDSTVGTFLRQGSTDPEWSTLVLPNAATLGDVLYASAANQIATLADVATGNALISGGVGAAPSWGKIVLTTHVSGILPMANGGTNNGNAFTTGSVIYFDGTRFQQDNSGLFFDAANNRLGVGVASPVNAVDIRATTPDLALRHSADTGFASLRYYEAGTERSTVQHVGSNYTDAARRDSLELVTLQAAGVVTIRPNDSEMARFSTSGLVLATALGVASGGSGRATATAYAVICGGTTNTGAHQSIAGVGTSGQVLTSNGAGALPTFQDAAGGGEPTEQTTTSTGTQNDFSLSAAYTVLRCNNASDLTLTGFTVGGSAPTAGDRVLVVSVGAGNVFLSHQAAGSTAANRLINFATSGVTPLAAGSGAALYQYDDTTDRWRLVAHEQGAWISTTFASGDYTAATGTWTVASGDVTTNAYRLSGRTFTIGLNITNTENSATTAGLRVAIPLGMTATKAIASYMRVGNDGGSAVAPGFVRVQASATNIEIFPTAGGGSFTGPDTGVFVQGSMSFEVN
jgi:hypothetical protein